MDRHTEIMITAKGGLNMTRYLIEESYTSQAAAAIIQNPQDRAEVLRPIFESVGGKLEHYFIAYSENTVYLLAEIPDLESLAALVMAFQAGGGPVSVKATPLMTATEAVGVMKKAGSLGYHPPTG
jgi:uncharacterized protein with GYD domain